MFRGKVQVAPLEMVDNVISGSKCGSTTVTINASINLFMERKKLNLNAHKCFRIHIGRKTIKNKNMEQLKYTQKK